MKSIAGPQGFLVIALGMFYVVKRLGVGFSVRRLKTVVTIGYCQRPVFSLGVSHHMHKITNL